MVGVLVRLRRGELGCGRAARGPRQVRGVRPRSQAGAGDVSWAKKKPPFGGFRVFLWLSIVCPAGGEVRPVVCVGGDVRLGHVWPARSVNAATSTQCGRCRHRTPWGYVALCGATHQGDGHHDYQKCSDDHALSTAQVRKQELQGRSWHRRCEQASSRTADTDSTLCWPYSSKPTEL
jgi:hypothetical protein